MPSNMRRLAADHAALHHDLPPYYLQPSDGDDLSQLNILLVGPPGTPFAHGIWKLHLKIPEDYPQSPPQAAFKTRIWHPNMEEISGAVCVDTLKRDWQPDLTLRDVLVTISCLLIYPNPDSALNASAGALMQEDYAAFAHQAKLMTSIHAPVPNDLKNAATEAKLRGEEVGTILNEREDEISARPTQTHRRTHISKKKTRQIPSEVPSHTYSHPTPPTSEYMMSEDEMDTATASKENDPSLSPSPVSLAPPSPRKTALGKRPLSVLSITYPEEDADMILVGQDSDADTPMTANERNISANTRSRTSSPLRKTPKLSMLCGGVNATGRLRDEMPIYEDFPQLSMADPARQLSGDGKENRVSPTTRKHQRYLSPSKRLGTNPLASVHLEIPTPSLSSFPSISSKVPKKKFTGVHKRANPKPKPRLGIRRL